jgi:hypothetical protein
MPYGQQFKLFIIKILVAQRKFLEKNSGALLGKCLHCHALSSRRLSI